ncbi:ATP-binding protein [Desulfosporosinus sp. FKA]|uniref:ATP-binding protein n=1 Tax=Desulfosporosinus sp. FKA TaxID=1969834 RepID=UPI000B49B1EC|nr:ATP-binding protein [Desulfosporosinus sp. FKA]
MGKIVKLRNYERCKKNFLYILIGIPCAGKSTYADSFVLDKPNFRIVSSDEIRKLMTGTYRFSLDSNREVFETAKNIIHRKLESGSDVIFDATNINKDHRISVIDIAKRNNSIAVAVVFKTPLSICLIRNAQRNSERRVPEDVIIRMSNFTEVSISEGFEKIISI